MEAHDTSPHPEEPGPVRAVERPEGRRKVAGLKTTTLLPELEFGARQSRDPQGPRPRAISPRRASKGPTNARKARHAPRGGWKSLRVSCKPTGRHSCCGACGNKDFFERARRARASRESREHPVEESLGERERWDPEDIVGEATTTIMCGHRLPLSRVDRGL